MTDSSSPGRPRLYSSSSEKVQAFRQRQAEGGYLRREVLLTQAVATRVAELAKAHQVSTIDVTSALLEQGLTAYESRDSLGSMAAAGVVRGVQTPAVEQPIFFGLSSSAPLTGPMASAKAPPQVKEQLTASSAAGHLVQAFDEQPNPSRAPIPAADPITDFFNRRKETLNARKS